MPPSPSLSEGDSRLLLSEDTASPNQDALFAELRQLADEWYRETGMFSVMHHKMMHPAYQRITNMYGRSAIPFILSELKARKGHWFVALSAITGENLIPEDELGNVPAMRERWLEWGRRNHYIDYRSYVIAR